LYLISFSYSRSGRRAKGYSQILPERCQITPAGVDPRIDDLRCEFAGVVQCRLAWQAELQAGRAALPAAGKALCVITTCSPACGTRCSTTASTSTSPTLLSPLPTPVWPVLRDHLCYLLPHTKSLRLDLCRLGARDIDRQMVLSHVVLNRQIQCHLRPREFCRIRLLDSTK
jgi:hypothetical protein